MAAFNRIFLMGTLVRDPELRAGGNGESRTEFRLAVDESRRSRSGELIKKTLFIDVLVWGAQAESSHRYLTQGSHVLVEGRLTAEEIEGELNRAKGKIQLLAVLDTLKYLRKGGRISTVAAFAGEMLSIKPVISVVGGEPRLVGKAMGSKKGNNLLNQLVDKCGGIDFSMPYILGYSGLSDAFLKKYIQDSANLWHGKVESIPYYLIGSTIGTHVGPGAIAVAFFAK